MERTRARETLPEWVRPKDVATGLGYSRFTARRWVETGELSAERDLSGWWRVSAEAVRDFVVSRAKRFAK
jgi:predicted site-specific integrase-resolvase